jgi:hypothetical protein
VRTDRGVPLYLRARAPDARIAALAPLEVQDAWAEPVQYGAAYDGGPLPFDWVWFTPRVDRGDPCDRWRRPPG